MKKIINLIVACGALISMASCDLDLEPTTGPNSGKVLTAEELKGMRLRLYNDIKAISSGGYLYLTDYFTDLVTETNASGNTGAFFYLWMLYANDQDISSMWNGYYGIIRDANYAIMKMEESQREGVATGAEINMYIGEMKFFRAYTLRQLALRFCEAYDPDKATTQPGIPVPDKYETGSHLERGTLADVYKQIQSDITDAELAVTTAGSANAIYLTADAITAFKAQVALDMHDYPNASKYASSLYASYPLVDSKIALEQMWREDTSTETIFQPEVNTTTLSSVSSMSDYYNGLWNGSKYVTTPYYVLEQHIVDLFSTEDYRMGIYLEYSYVQLSSSQKGNGYLLTKFIGNKFFRSALTQLNYKNMPKVFRVAQMYLIDAEAQYQQNGGGAGPLNTLRQSRGLEPTDATGKDLFDAIKDEYVREMMGEGYRLSDLKRWKETFQRDYQSALRSVVRTRGRDMNPNVHDPKCVWPIPQDEIENNPNFGSQNPGYAQ